MNWTFSNQGPFTLGTRNITLSGASGGSGTGYVYSLAPSSPTVPGMRVQNGAPLPNNFNATAGLIGVLTQTGTFPITIRVEDAANAANFIERSATITASPLQILSQSNLPKARWGASYTPFTLEPTGLFGAAQWSATGLPTGMSIGAVTGVLSGTPTGGAATTTNNVNVTLTDLSTSQSVTVGFTLVVNGNDILPASGTLPLGRSALVYPTQTFTTSLACGGTLHVGVRSSRDGYSSRAHIQHRRRDPQRNTDRELQRHADGYAQRLCQGQRIEDLHPAGRERDATGARVHRADDAALRDGRQRLLDVPDRNRRERLVRVVAQSGK